MKVKNQYLKILEYLHLSFNKWPSIQYKFLFFETTIMGTLLTWQWSKRRSLTSSTKRVSHRGSLLKGVAVQWVLYQSILNAKLTGRKKLGWKMCTHNRDDRSFTRSELKLETVHQETPRSDIFRKKATKPLLKYKHRQKHFTWAKEKNNWTVAQWFKVLFSDENTFCI